MDALYRLSYIGNVRRSGLWQSTVFSPGLQPLFMEHSGTPRTLGWMRIVVANIQSGIGVTKGYRQYLSSGWRYILPHAGEGALGAGAFLKLEDADVALLTEVDGGSHRSRGVSQLEVIARESGLPHAQFFPTRSIGASVNEGNAVLSRFPITRSQSYPLKSRVNPRVLGETALDVDGTPVTVLVVHLALNTRFREAQLREIAERVHSVHGPLILGGDFNERDHRAFAALRRAGLEAVSVASYPSWKPRHALQVLFHTRDVAIASASVPNDALFSDHLPLIVHAELTDMPMPTLP